MVFVLGMLTLVGLVGLILLARTTGEARRISLDVSARAYDSAMDDVIRGIQQRLRQDVWGPAPSDVFPQPLDGNKRFIPAAPPAAENNEPFDAPGPADRWLASTTPYLAGDRPPWRGTPLPPPDDVEEQVLAWPHVSYLGTDLFRFDAWSNGPTPYAWAADARMNPPAPGAVTYPPDANSNLVPEVEDVDSFLKDALILQTPPPGMAGDLIPGSTTNRTIAQARRAWEDPAHQALLAAELPGTAPQFPYFDTNADGLLDLYDADGDGIPDSPISFSIPIETDDPNEPARLYAVIRIVDHGSMLNVNVASSAELPNGNLMFDETLADLQRRGRRTTELFLDDVLHEDDRRTRAAELVSYRNNSPLPDPVGYDNDVVRRLLVGGPAPAANYLLYGAADEASLRHRGLLVPFDRRDEKALTGFETIDRALPGTLQWNRRVQNNVRYDVTGASGSYARWNRLNANWMSAGYEGYDDAGDPDIKGWRSLLVEQRPYFVRRHLLTTVSREVMPPPIITSDSTVPPLLTPKERLNDLRSRLMDWPILNEPAYAEAGDLNPATMSSALANQPDVPDHLRVLRIDLNMSAPTSALAVAAKNDFIRYAAAAMYVALEDVPDYQGQRLVDDPSTPEDESLNREYFAWQFAVNLADYRDADNVPTIWPWRTAAFGDIPVIGVEKQPFFTEAFVHLKAGQNPSTNGGPLSHSGGNDKWFHAVEMYVPPFWQIPTDRLHVRSVDGGENVVFDQPLNSFLRVPGGQLPVLDGGIDGRYVVLTGATNFAPAGLSSLFTDVTKFVYRNPAFSIPSDGFGRVELVYRDPADPTGFAEHVLDVIGPQHANGNTPLVGGRTIGTDDWAARPAGANPGEEFEYSMLRSTNGWRFTATAQVYTKPIQLASGFPPFQPSLGEQNECLRILGQPNTCPQDDATSRIDRNVPPSAWPARVGINGVSAPDSFGEPRRYGDFDSPADLGRMFMIGPVKRMNAAAPPFLRDRSGNLLAAPGQYPTTEILAVHLATSQGAEWSRKYAAPGESPTPERPERTVAGRVDFRAGELAENPDRSTRPWPDGRKRPWTWRLMDFFTTNSPLFDRLDNDGNGAFDLADPAEGVRLVNRVAGRINVNTAPAAVLRALPFMSFLPNSPEWLLHLGQPVASPATEFFNNQREYWDIASGIVAARETRDVPLVLPDGTGQLRVVALAGLKAPGLTGARPRPGENDELTPAGNDNAYVHAAETLWVSSQWIEDPSDLAGSVTARDAAFVMDRFDYPSAPADARPALRNHAAAAGDPLLGDTDAVSPDFRFRRADNDDDGRFDTGQGDDWVADFVPVLTPAQLAAGKTEPLGQRARDVFLSRFANLLTVRSDVFTAYVALLDEDGRYVMRSTATLDRSNCFLESFLKGVPVLPQVLSRSDGGYAESAR